MRNRKKAFTLIELLVVVSIIALLVAILMPALNKAREQAKRVVCSNNVKSIVSFYNMEALENNDKYMLPNNGNWLWDIDEAVTDKFEKHGGVREMYYCPSDMIKDERMDDLWWFSPGNFRVINYFILLDWSDEYGSSNGLTKDELGFYRPAIKNFNDSIRKTWVRTLSCKFPAEQELMMDAVLTEDRPSDATIFASDYEDGNFDDISTGGSDRDKTNHTTMGGTPIGGNMGFVDGHVEWRDVTEMHWRSEAGGSGPYFWW